MTNPLFQRVSSASGFARRGYLFTTALGFVLGLLLAGWLASAVMRSVPSEGFTGWLRSRLEPRPAVIQLDRPAIIRQIQRLQRLETVVYTVERIVSGEREGLRYLPDFLTGERIMLIVHGEVTAGVDLGKLQPEDVVVRERTVELRLPPAEVFATRIDNNQTRVYSRETGLFTPVDPNLETEVRREAERVIREAAIQDGLLETAAENARSALVSLAQGFGFAEVEFH